MPATVLRLDHGAPKLSEEMPTRERKLVSGFSGGRGRESNEVSISAESEIFREGAIEMRNSAWETSQSAP